MVILVGIIIFVLLVLVHEFGHFIAAKRNGVTVEEFGIGFPPKLVGKKMGKGFWRCYYTINLLPLGGFVRLKGENATDKRPGSFGRAGFSAKAKIALAGVVMNAVVAMAIFSIQAGTGLPQLFEEQIRFESYITSSNQRVSVANIVEGSPADELGLQNGDIVSAINGQTVRSEDQLVAQLASRNGQLTEITFQSAGQQKSEQVVLNEIDHQQGIIGVTPIDLEEVRYNWLVAPFVGIATFGQYAALTLQGLAVSLWNLIGGNFDQAAENVAGPVGIFAILGAFSTLGFDYVFFFAAVISLTLAIINVLPLPALDGGRLAIAFLVDKVKIGITDKREELIHLAGFIALLILAIIITVVDINRF